MSFLIILGVVVTFGLYRLQKTVRRMGETTGVLAHVTGNAAVLLAATAAVTCVALSLRLANTRRAEHKTALAARQLDAERRMAEALGACIRPRIRQDAALLVIDRAATPRQRDLLDAHVEGLRAGLADRAEITTGVLKRTRVTADASEAERAEAVLVQARAFDALVRNQEDVDVVVSFVGLPLLLDRSRTLARVQRSGLQLAVATDNVYNLGALIESGAILACAVPTPRAAAESSLRTAPAATAEQQQQPPDHGYLLITSQNVLRVAKRNRDLFNVQFRPRLKIKL